MVQKSLQTMRRQRRRHFSGRGCRKRSLQLYWRLIVLRFTWSRRSKNRCKHGMLEWEALATNLFLKWKYFCSETKDDISVEQHLKNTKAITDKLAATGAPISEEDQVVTLFRSLPRSLASPVPAIKARMEGVSLDYVQQAFIHEKMKQTELLVSWVELSHHWSGALRRGMPHDRPTCLGCGDVSHISRNCPSHPRRDRSSWFGCGDVGHIRRYCPRKFKWYKAVVAGCGER